MQEFTPLEYLQIDIASRYGLDKKSWSERLIWFNFNEARLGELVDEAKDPALFYAGVCAYNDYLEGIPSGYAVNLDCTASGLQLLSALAKDVVAASNCNVIGTECKDFYTEAYDEMKVSEPSLNISRADAKDAIMTAVYGSSKRPKMIFGEDNLPVFYETMLKMAPRAWHLNQAFLSLADPTAYTYETVMPDNFDVNLPVESKVSTNITFGGEVHTVITKVNSPVEHDLSLGANLTHATESYLTRELIRRAAGLPTINHSTLPDAENDLMVQILWNLYQQSGMLSVRIFDYLSTYNMRFVDVNVMEEYSKKFAETPFSVLTVHDCFRCLPKYANEMRKIYHELFKELIESNMAIYILESVSGKEYNITLDNPLEGLEIGEYLIC